MIKNIFNNITRISLSIGCVGVALIGRADTVMPPRVVTLMPGVATVKWEKNDEIQRWGVLNLDRPETLKLSFDILEDEFPAEDMPWLRCRIKRRSLNWEDDKLLEIEYLKGFNESDIGYGEMSEPGVTTRAYRHYETQVPPPNIELVVSGNYLLEVYAVNNPDSIILSVPFLVEDDKARITSAVTTATDVDYNGSHQQISMELSKDNLPAGISPQDIIIKLGRNFESYSWRTLSAPTSLLRDALVYSHVPQLLFPAGNEYRRFDTSNQNHPGIHVESIEWDNEYYNFRLETDESRFDGKYLFDNTQQGGFTVNVSGMDNADLEADYVKVIFSLKTPGFTNGNNIYIVGDFSNGNTDTPMEYDAANDIFHKTMVLKQGAYDYQYVTDRQITENTASEIEGDFYNTKNIYPVAVYYRVPGERTYRLALATIIKPF